MRKEGALMVANRELSEKQKEKVEKEINYMFYELYTKRMSAEAAQEIAKATYEKVKNEYELGKGHLSNEDDKNLREWIYGGIHEGAEIIKIITDFLPAGKAAKVLKTIKESWNNKGDYSKSVPTSLAAIIRKFWRVLELNTHQRQKMKLLKLGTHWTRFRI